MSRLDERLAALLGRGDAQRVQRLAETDAKAAMRALVRARIEQNNEATGASPAWWPGGRYQGGRRPSERGL